MDDGDYVFQNQYVRAGLTWKGFVCAFIGIIQTGRHGWADRFTYIPYIGLSIIIAWGLPKLLSKWPYRKIVCGVSMVIVLMALGICAQRQVSYWKNSLTLFSHALEVTQNNCLVYNNFGVAYGNLGRYNEAVEAYRQAIRIKPDYAEAYRDLGAAYDNLGRYQEAVEAFKQAVTIQHQLHLMPYPILGVTETVVEPLLEDVIGIPCHVLTFKYKNMEEKFWVAQDNSMLILKFRKFFDSVLSEGLDVESVSSVGDLWYPTKATRYSISKFGVSKRNIEVISFEPDLVLPADTFEFKPAAGTLVFDDITHTKYFVGLSDLDQLYIIGR